MDLFSQLLGLIIIFLIIVFPILRWILLEKDRKKTPSKYDPRIERKIEKPLLNPLPTKLESVPKQSPPKKTDTKILISSYAERMPEVLSESFISEEKISKNKRSRFLRISNKSELKKMIIYSEILGDSKGFELKIEHDESKNY